MLMVVLNTARGATKVITFIIFHHHKLPLCGAIKISFASPHRNCTALCAGEQQMRIYNETSCSPAQQNNHII